MFQNLQHHPTITQAQHRALAAISNTDLSTLADELLGRPRRDCTAAFAFGSHFHTATLEPHLFEPTNAQDPADHRQRQAAAQLATAVRQLFPEPAYQVGCGGSHIWLHRADESQRLACVLDHYQ